MSKNIFFSFFSLFFLFAQPCFSAGAATRLTYYLEQMHSFQADFIQTQADREGKTRFTGHITVLRPDGFRWEVISPDRQLVIARTNKAKKMEKAKELLVYDPDLQQLVIRSLSGEQAAPAALLLGTSSLTEKNWAIRMIDASSETFELASRDKNSLFSRLVLVFRAGKLAGMRLMTSAGQVTQVTFQHVQYNRPVSPDLFQFVPPRGTDIIYDP